MASNIILMHISNISGHKQATQAVTNAIHQLNPEAEVMSLNAFNYTNPLSEKIINSLYMGVIKSTPKVWKYLYDNPKVVKNTGRIKEMIHKSNAPKLRALFEKFTPDAIACSQAFPCGMVAYYKKIYKSNVPLIGILTDYTAHSYWLYDTVDYYIVPSESVKGSLVRKGVPEGKVKIYGIPIEPKFSLKPEASLIRRELGLDSSLATILVMGGGQGLGPITKIAGILDKIERDFQIIIVCGTNKKIFDKLSGKNEPFKKKTVIMGFTNEIDRLMSAADMLITKPGGITTAEALAKGLPMLIIRPIPGQEESNTKFLLENGAAMKIERLNELPLRIHELLDNPALFKTMSKNALAVSRPNSSLDIASLILQLCQKEKT